MQKALGFLCAFLDFNSISDPEASSLWLADGSMVGKEVPFPIELTKLVRFIFSTSYFRISLLEIGFWIIPNLSLTFHMSGSLHKLFVDYITYYKSQNVKFDVE